MTNYIPHYRKKKDALEKKENELIKNIHNHVGLDKLSELAENVRAAKIRVINANVAQLRPDLDKNDQKLVKAKQDIEELQALSTDEIIRQYKQTT